MKELTLKQLAQWCGGQIQPEHADVVISGTQHDSRDVRPGDLFIAIAGERVDGHGFVSKAREAGAAAALVSHPVEDELPQILIVLLGNMSLVGPRPYLPREKEKMGSHFDTICMTTPGITGLWQVSGRSDVSFAGRLHLDEWYVHNWSVWVDVMCLFKTVKIVVFGKGAY